MEKPAHKGPETRQDAFPVEPTPAGPLVPRVTRAAAQCAQEAARAVDRFIDARRRHEPIPLELQTYQRDAPYCFAWPATSNSGNLSATRGNVFAYNMAYQVGLALPTVAYPLRTPIERHGEKFDRIHDVLTPAQLAAPFGPNPRGGPPRDAKGVRKFFRDVEPARARPGDWVLYMQESGAWTHVDLVEKNETQGKLVRLVTVGAGNTPPNDLYRGGVVCNLDGTMPGNRTWARVMVLRTLHMREFRADGSVNPDPTARSVAAVP